jgi:hypothetical protein
MIMLRERTLRVLHKVLEERVFLRGKIDALSTALYELGEAIEFQVANHQGVRAAYRAATQQGLGSDQELRKGKWLGEVVIRPCLKEKYFVFHRIAGSEDKHGDTGVSAADALQYFASIDAGDHEVKDDEVIGVGLGHFEALPPVGDDIHCVTLGHQAACDKSRDLRFIFDYKNAQRRPLFLYRLRL